MAGRTKPQPPCHPATTSVASNDPSPHSQAGLMERGVYFDAWFPRQHCYHPSLPPRRLRMVETWSTTTPRCWSGRRSAAARSRCPTWSRRPSARSTPASASTASSTTPSSSPNASKHGIKVFGIVFEVQGWEFPVELNEAEDRDSVAQRAARRRQARLAGAARVLAEPLPQALAAVRALLSRRADQQRRRAGHRPARRSAARATSTACPATRTGWSAPTASTSATRWTATTRSGASI